MMDSLRTSANSIVLKIILGMIIISFVLTGVSSYLIGAKNTYVAKVNAQDISYSDFVHAVSSERNRMQQEFGNRFSELAASEDYMKALRQRVLNQLINEVLLNQYAKRLGIAISDHQVKQAIFQTQAFQSEGKFNNDRFNKIINQMEMTADQYAQVLRDQLVIKQLINAIIGSDFTLPGTTDRLVGLVTQQRVVRQATIIVDVLAMRQQVSTQEINSYYEQHKKEFMSPEQFRVSYIELDAATMQQEDASNSEIQSYYDQYQQGQFTLPERVRYSVIQSKTEADAIAVLDALGKGADFATLAKEKSIDIISAKNGGDMGWLEASTIPNELKNAGLKEKNQLSGVIKSSVGFLIARFDDVQPAKKIPLAEVWDDIKAKVKQKKAQKAYYALQQKVSDAVSKNNNKSLTNAEQIAGVKVVETAWFSRSNLPAELNFKPVADAIFNGGLVGQNSIPGSNSDVITVDDNRAFVLRVNEHKAEIVKPLLEVKEKLIDIVKHTKAEQQAKLDANRLLAKLNAREGDKAMKAVGLSFGAPITLSRIDQNPLSQTVFSLPLPNENRPVYGLGNDMQGNIVLVSLDKVIDGTMPEAQRKEMIAHITQNNAEIIFNAMMLNLRKDAKIKLGDVITQLQ